MPSRLATSLLLATAAAAALPAARGQDAAEPPRLDLVLHHGATYLELEVGGARGLFLLDTGANTSGVDGAWLEASGARHRPGERTTVGGTTGPIQLETAVFERLDLGSGFFRDARLCVQDFGGFSRPGGRPQAGLLGTDLLNSYRVTVDYRARSVRLALRGERTPPPPGLAATTVTYDRGLPTANVRVGGVDLPCRLDSGASYRTERLFLDVNRAAVAALRAAGRALVRDGSIGVVGVGGPARLPLLTGPPGAPLALDLAGVRLEGVVLVVHDRGTLAVDRPLTLASASVLARLGRFVLDPFDRLLWVQARPRLGPV